MEVDQSPGRKPFQQSPLSASFFRAALPFMVRLREVVSGLLRRTPRSGPESLRLSTAMLKAPAS
jgi:hypothetical protein